MKPVAYSEKKVMKICDLLLPRLLLHPHLKRSPAALQGWRAGGKVILRWIRRSTYLSLQEKAPSWDGSRARGTGVKVITGVQWGAAHRATTEGHPQDKEKAIEAHMNSTL